MALRNLKVLVGLSSLAAIATACESGSGDMSTHFGGGTQAAVGDSCNSSDPNQICLGVRYVSYQDSGGTAVVSSELAASNIRATNAIYKQCGIQFQIDEYKAVDPTTLNLAFGAQSVNQLDAIRNTFGFDDSLLIVQTGPWGTVKNAWTSTPGTGTYGAVLEASVADFPNILAHELGHYLNLDHVNDRSNLLDAIIYPDSVNLTQDQCQTMRSAATQFWGRMRR